MELKVSESRGTGRKIELRAIPAARHWNLTLYLCFKAFASVHSRLLRLFMVYIFFLLDTIKSPVNSSGWFICFKNNKNQAARVIKRHFFFFLLFSSFCVCVWKEQLLPLQFNPLVLPLSVFDTLFGFMPERPSAVSRLFAYGIHIEVGLQIWDVCTLF